ncbi:MAG: cell division protein FtsL [Gammaproteobacteria bacterium]|nr:cell division protein FtsL [Gammaproteobacteria bacterium]
MNTRIAVAWLFAVVAFLTALAVVVTKHDSRRLFVELQTLEDDRDVLNVEWNQLQLEESAWSTQARIETAARRRLDMQLPPGDAFKVIVQ